MIYTLGLNLFHANSSACIFRNGELVCAVEEERFNRKKNSSGFPKESIIFCLKKANISIDKVDYITINQNTKSNILQKIYYILKNKPNINFLLDKYKNKKKRLSINSQLSKLGNEFSNFKGKIIQIDHHESHIGSSLFFSNHEEAVNLSVDGFGDFCSVSWGYNKGNDLVIDGRVYYPHSLGIFYQSMTQYLGFKNYGDEYKVMGLSAYGTSKYYDAISNLIDLDHNGKFKLNLKYFIFDKKKIDYQFDDDIPSFPDLYSNLLIDLLGPSRNKQNEEINQKHMDIAKATQIKYEECFFNILNFLYEKYDCKNLNLSGGCAMNSLANGKITTNSKFKSVYISPNPADGGGSIGSASSYLNKKKIQINKNFNLSYLGPSYTEIEIDESVMKYNLQNTFKAKKYDFDKINSTIARKITEGKVIGWFQDGSEWGPRALGNRSILADPRNKDMKKILNSKIKRRESFRPFAPSILEERVGEWFEISLNVPFMTEVFPIKKSKRELIPAVCHIDSTGRLQTVNQVQNKKYYNLIKEFEKITNIPILLNTSFNENEPIVNTPGEAIECFTRTNMDILVINNWLIEK